MVPQEQTVGYTQTQIQVVTQSFTDAVAAAVALTQLVAAVAQVQQDQAAMVVQMVTVDQANGQAAVAQVVRHHIVQAGIQVTH
jgi:hypothetical protein